MPFKYQPQWQGPLSGRSFEKQTEDFLNGIESRVDEIDTRQTPSDATPMPPGAGSAGTSGEYSRGDHSHPLQSSVSGNAGSADVLSTPREISMSGEGSGSAYFNGSADASIPLEVACIATGSTERRRIANRFAETANVMDFGAKGDGVADDTAAIQASLNAAAGRIVIFPCGNYCISGTVDIPADTTIFGAGDAVITNTNSELVILFNVAEPNTFIDGLSFVNLQKGTSVAGISFDNVAVLIGKGGDSCSVTNCRFDNFVSGIWSTTNNDGLIKDIYISGCRFNKYDFALLLDDFDGCTISGCFGRNAEKTRYDPNYTFKPPHLLYVTDMSGTASRALSVTNCIESGNVYSSSFKVRNVIGVTITGCVSDLSCRGYEIGACADVSVTGNVFSNAVVCQGDAFQPAYWVTDVDRCCLTGNTASFPSGVAGISFRLSDNCKDVLIANNNVTLSFNDNTYKYIFDLFYVSNITIHGNVITNTSGETFSHPIINISNTTNGVVADNVYRDVGQTNHPLLVSAIDSTGIHVRLGAMLFSSTRHLSVSFTNCTDSYSFDEGTIPPSYYSSRPPLHFFDDNYSGLRLYGDGVAVISNNSRIAAFFNSETHLYGNGCIADCSVYPGTGATYDLGLTNKRWNNVWVTSGVINDSDQRVKTRIRAFPEKVLDAWESVDFVQFQRVEAVEKKGLAARLHAGVIAQNIKAAFEANGLDPTVYGLFCHDEWEAEEEVRDEDGTIMQDAMEAGDRYSLRYDELLCLEAACQRRRAERLEARVAALEAQKA